MAIKTRKNIAPMRAPTTATTPTKTSTTAPSGNGGGRGNGHSVTAEERYHMIAQSAYYRAEQRGYEGGHEVEDWLAAEAEVDAHIRSMGATIK